MDSCPGEHAWPNTAKAMWDAHMETVSDPRCRDMLSDFYNTDKPPILEKPRKSSTERAPQGVEQISGRVSPYNSFGTVATHQSKGAARPKVDPCKPPSSTAPLVCKDIVLPNPSSRKSFEPWSGGPSKPCYRKKTKYGVYVGLQSLPDTSAVDEETIRPWDNDTWIPPGGIFLKYTPSP